ncbi:MAG: protein translocase subunit SecF [Candidatus Cyclonatronum sp.]|uniref:protein translocase subunit SecF n=1 Tax=Cyclonatronum sp. TaxID=3024185 RepID=UPI0025C08C48|nr:protein translocase subunit SecF [Cyclonatronum sp.]MCC5933291.1 protein translocase subunit SecF [Balneolales bacterium]MCH8485387.1 protein translocase subunit SecF [Cyclonatronum sp.]
MRVFEDPKFELIHNRKIGYIISSVLVILSIGAILVKGLQFGIDFRGGTEIVVAFEGSSPAVEEIRNILTDPLGSAPEVRTFGADINIRTDVDLSSNEIQRIIVESLAVSFPGNTAEIIKTDLVGPRFAEDLRNAALQSVLFALAIIFIYILIRFKKWYYSAGAVAALAHDVIITLGLFTLLYDVVPFSLDINQAIIAAFLTIVGYSLNDTVVVFDRIRENSLIFKTEAYDNMVNRSVNNTLSRTFVTSVTTLIAVSILFFFGGEVLKGLSFALILGVILGTYSSIFIASGLVVDLQLKKANS